MPAHMLRPEGLTQHAIESVLGQTLSDFELIVIDDGSVDGLWQVLVGYQATDPRIVLVRHIANSGLWALRLNEGILLSKGTYLAYMFEDDEWLPSCLSSLVTTITEGSHRSLVYGVADLLVRRPDGTTKEATLGGWDFNYAELMAENRIAHCGVLHSRELLNAVGLFDPHILMRRLSDYDMWRRLGRRAAFHRCSQTVARVHAGLKHSVGSRAGLDVFLAYRYMATDRTTALSTHRLPDYDVDSLAFIGDPSERDRVRRRYVVPFFCSHPRALTATERITEAVLPDRTRRLLVTKPDYSTSVEVTLGNFARVLGRLLSVVFLRERELELASPADFDTLVLYRTIGPKSLAKISEARRAGRAAVYLMDDNMLKFGTGYMSEVYAYLKPGSPNYKTLEQQIASVDLLLSYSPTITSDCASRNPRVLELSTNIEARFICDASPHSPLADPAPRRPLKYAILSGGTVRSIEISAIWGYLGEFAGRHKDGVELHLWGFDSTGLTPLACPVYHRQFDHSYESYLRALQEEGFDYVICPLFDDHDTKKSKSPIKYLEATVAGAVGLFSDSVAYSACRSGTTCLKVHREPEGWLAVLEESYDLSPEERHAIFYSAKQHILETFTTESQALRFFAALEAADLHANLKSLKRDQGRATIAYFFHESLLGGATIHLLRHAAIARDYGFRPILCFPTGRPIAQDTLDLAARHGLGIQPLDFRCTAWAREPDDDDQRRSQALEKWLKDTDVALVHVVTNPTDAILAAGRLHLPIVMSLHYYYDHPKGRPLASSSSISRPQQVALHSSSLRFSQQWAEALGVQDPVCIRAPIEKAAFAAFAQKHTTSLGNLPRVLVVGTLQPRKGQLESIEAVRLLRDQGIDVELVLLGYSDLVPGHVDECRQLAVALGLEDIVKIEGFAKDPSLYYQDADFLLCASVEESFPQAILQAMARGVRVVTTPAGGIKELVVDGWTGIVLDSFDKNAIAEGLKRAIGTGEHHWRAMLEQAHMVAKMVSAEDVVAGQLLQLYNRSTRMTIPEIPRLELPPPPTTALPAPAEVEKRRPPKGEWQARRITARGLTYKVEAPAGAWSGLEVRFATYMSEVEGTMCISIEPASLGGPSRSLEVFMKGISDNALHPVRFEPIRNQSPEEYRIRFRPVFSAKGMKVAIYETHRSGGWLGKIWRRIVTTGADLEYRMLVE
jgi:glycosyltransferase involved in cell wall biosynthesis